MTEPLIHPGQTSEALDQERAEGIRRGRIAAKFHYETPRQAELWLTLHEQFAPPADLAPLYEQAAQATAAKWPHNNGTLIALGCGGGEKDCRLFSHLPAGTRYVPTDVSEPLVRQATAIAERTRPGAEIIPLVFDLAAANDLAEFIEPHLTEHRMFTFFGLLPNFPPGEILTRLRALLSPGDALLLSANLAPHGIEAILPQYDNNPTHNWLSEFLRANGLSAGTIEVKIERDGTLQRIAFYHIGAEQTLLLFVSYRYSLPTLHETLVPQGIHIEQEFISANGEEGVFFCSVQ